MFLFLRRMFHDYLGELDMAIIDENFLGMNSVILMRMKIGNNVIFGIDSLFKF